MSLGWWEGPEVRLLRFLIFLNTQHFIMKISKQHYYLQCTNLSQNQNGKIMLISTFSTFRESKMNAISQVVRFKSCISLNKRL